MTIQQMTYFCTVASLQHVSQASEILNISQPSLSYAIKTLEEELGVELFIKDGRNIRLTSFGEIYYKHFSKALEEIKIAKNEVYKSRFESINIAHTTIMGINYIPDIVQKFKAEHDIHFNMVQSNISGIPILLKNGECDFGFGSFFEDKDMDYLELFQEKIDLLVPPNHRLASKKSVCFADFADEELISFQKTAHIYKQVQEIYASRGKTPKIAGEVTNEVVMGNMVFRSNLVALVPRVENYNYYNAKLLPITDIDVHRSLYVYWCKNRPLSDTLKKFLSFIVKTKTTN